MYSVATAVNPQFVDLEVTDSSHCNLGYDSAQDVVLLSPNPKKKQVGTVLSNWSPALELITLRRQA